MSDQAPFVEAPLIDRTQAHLTCVFGAGRDYNRDVSCRLATSPDAKARRHFTKTDPVAGTRICGACGQTKPLVEFHRDRHTSLGRRHTCAPCQRAAMREYAAKRAA